MTSAPQDIAKVDLLRDLGYGGDLALYDQALQEAGLSNPRKPRIALDKRDRVAALLAEKFCRVCARGDCSNAAPARAHGRRIVPAATQATCEICGGSANRSAVDELVAAFRTAGWSRVVVVGGSPATRQDLSRQLGSAIELRLVDGTISRTLAAAEADVAWADLVVVWASTELSHKVSTLYRGPKVVTARSRGVTELARAAATAAGNATARSARR